MMYFVIYQNKKPSRERFKAVKRIIEEAKSKERPISSSYIAMLPTYSVIREISEIPVFQKLICNMLDERKPSDTSKYL